MVGEPLSVRARCVCARHPSKPHRSLSAGTVHAQRVNIIAFQAGWFASILLAANGWPWAAILAALAVVALHLARARDARAELKLTLAAGAIGLVGGPLSYMAGERLGAIMLLERDAALLALVCGWGLLTPLLLALAKRRNGCLPAVQENSMSGAQHA